MSYFRRHTHTHTHTHTNRSGTGVGEGGTQRSKDALFARCLWEHFVFKKAINDFFEELVCTIASAVTHVLHHKITELVHMAGRLENSVWRQVRAFDLEHVLLQHEVLAPLGEKVGLQRTGRRTKVVPKHAAASKALCVTQRPVSTPTTTAQTPPIKQATNQPIKQSHVQASYTVVDVERGHHEHTPSQQVVQKVFVRHLHEGGHHTNVKERRQRHESISCIIAK